MANTNQQMNIIIAVDNIDVREKVLSAVQLLPFTLIVTDNSYGICEANLDVSLVILETNDDIAALTQCVYEIYRKCTGNSRPLIIGMASGEQMRRNPRACLWNIDGHAALLALLTVDRPDFVNSLRALLQRI